jgi:protoporphyrinogen oxidase
MICYHKDMHIGIIGAGFTGLTSALRLLQQGHKVTIFEKDELPGGLAIGFHQKGWDWPLEKHYHHVFTTDHFVRNLAVEVGVPFTFSRPNTSSLIDGEILQLDSPLKLLAFKKLTLSERVRMGTVLAYLKYSADWRVLESEKADSWLREKLGGRPYSLIWEPLLRAKFGSHYKEISLSWFWARIKARTTELGYPPGGFQNLVDAVVCQIKELKGKLIFETEVFNINSQEQGVEVFYKQGQMKKDIYFDRVLVTLPNVLFGRIAPQLPEEYVEKLNSFKGIGAVNMVLELSESFLPDDVYWLNICDSGYPFLAVVEHTHFVKKNHYNRNHILYVGNYLPQSHRYFSLSTKELLAEYAPYLDKLHPGFKKDILSINVFKVPFAQPIVTPHFSQKILSMKTPLSNVFLANMQQVYPWDRGTNYAVELGEKAAKEILKIRV